MADNLIVQGTNISMDFNSAVMVLSGLKAGEALLAAAPCKVHTDGKVYLAVATDTNFVGFSVEAVAVNRPVTLYRGRFHYSDGDLDEGVALYLSDTKGRLTDTVPVAGTPVAVCVNDSDIVVIR